MRMFAIDKQLHFLGCYFICASLYVLFGWVWVGVGMALFAGVMKELVDSRKENNYWSWGDIVADVAGIAAFLLQIYLIKL